MFLLTGLAVGLVLFARASMDRHKKLLEARDDSGKVSLRKALRLSVTTQYKGAALMLIPMLLGHWIDLILGTTVHVLFD